MPLTLHYAVCTWTIVTWAIWRAVSVQHSADGINTQTQALVQFSGSLLTVVLLQTGDHVCVTLIHLHFLTLIGIITSLVSASSLHQYIFLTDPLSAHLLGGLKAPLSALKPPPVCRVVEGRPSTICIGGVVTYYMLYNKSSGLRF